MSASEDTQAHARNVGDLVRRPDIGLASRPTRTVADVAFDDFVVESDALDVKGSLLERGADAEGRVLAAASVDWPEMPVSWTALQSRSSDDHLVLGDDVEPVGNRRFDSTFAVDTDDVEGFTHRFAAPLLEWMADFDDEHGPLTIIFDSTIDGDRRRGPEVSAIFVARLVADDAEFIATAKLAATVADHLAAAMHA
ncbi:MAG: hypothetical protein HKN44_11755 [Ilumatobacter sp.]|nr:hypothetical protein [Ilumatobacter sp.]